MSEWNSINKYGHMTMEGFGWKLGYVNEFVELTLVAKLDHESLILVSDHGQHSSYVYSF